MGQGERVGLLRGLLKGVGAPAISSVKVGKTSVAPDGALTRPKRSYCNATHQDSRLGWKMVGNPRLVGEGRERCKPNSA